MTILFLAWQDQETREWLPVARLTCHGDSYEFVYTQGALKSARFIPFGRMKDIHKIYRSESLFPLFQNRILATTRPEYSRYIDWLGLQSDAYDPLKILARSGGYRGTDSLQIYNCPERTDDGYYTTRFFVHGIRHMVAPVPELVNNLKVGQSLLPILDISNPKDPGAVALRSADPAMMIGYVPRYLAADIGNLARTAFDTFSIAVEKVNEDAPVQFRILCFARCKWPTEFEPCSGEVFAPLV